MNIKTPHFDNLFDDFSIWQHNDGTNLIISEGYALDDATRGLIVCLVLDKRDKANILFDYIVKSRKDNAFFGFANSKREFINSPASEDAVGQVAWAMGYCFSVGFRAKESKDLFESITPELSKMRSLRGPVYFLLGALYIDKRLSMQIASDIVNKFDKLNTKWLWPEDTITYGNGIIPYALLRYAYTYQDAVAYELGLDILMFLENICTNNRIRGPIGTEGWYKYTDTPPANYLQQPIDSAYMIWAWLGAYQTSNNESHLDNAIEWFKWFEGNNIAKSPMYDKDTLNVFDGIDELIKENRTLDYTFDNGINFHSGAESNIVFLLSYWMMQTKQTV